jgi:4'-phosphopantetheinyl transferase
MSSTDDAWLPPPRRLDLPPEEVDVWRFSLEQPADVVAALAELLDADERVRAERFAFERVRRQFIVGRGMLRRVLARYLDVDPRDVRFHYGNHGKPRLPESGVAFNLTHSEGRALLGVTGAGEVGVDLECVRRMTDLEGIARRFFAPGEVAALTTLEESLRELAFFHCWTRKEAFIKALGDGLSYPLDQFAVTLHPAEPARLLWVHGEPDAHERWQFTHLDPWPGYVGCVALAAPGWRLRCWECE